MIVEDWRPFIVEMVMTKQNLSAWDPSGAFPFHYPEVAAPEERIAAVEQELGVRLDPEHRGFLGFADGWPAFHQHVALLGCGGLTAGALKVEALSALAEQEEAVEDTSYRLDDLVVIAASLEQADIFLMPVVDGRVERVVFWIAEGELVGTFDSFGQYFVSMIEYTKRRITKMQELARGVDG